MNKPNFTPRFGFHPLSQSMEPKLLGEMAGSKPGTEKIEMHFKHSSAKSKEYSKNDRGVLKGYRSQLEGA